MVAHKILDMQRRISLESWKHLLLMTLRLNLDQEVNIWMPFDDSLCKVSICLEQGPLQTQCSEKETESLSTEGIRQNTSPSPGGPKIVPDSR